MPIAKALVPSLEGHEFETVDFERIRFHAQQMNESISKSLRDIADLSARVTSVAYPEDEIFRALRPVLRTLSSDRSIGLSRRFLLQPLTKDWREAELEKWPEWNVQGENLVLLTLSALCRLGAVTQNNGSWQRTVFGKQIAFTWQELTPLEAMQQIWTTRVLTAHLNALKWAWDTFQAHDSRQLLIQLVSDAKGVLHSELPTASRGAKGRRLALQTVAAAAALGAVWFTGWRWEPTLYGVWLANHPQSALRAI